MPSQAKVINRLARACKPPSDAIDLLDLEPDPILEFWGQIRTTDFYEKAKRKT